MLCRRWCVISLFACFAFAMPLAALPQLAVLRVVLTPGVDPAVGEIVTQKIEEPIVGSGRYEVLDRSHVEQVLTEKEFQLSSGLVKPEEVRQAGEYLGADLVVAGTISRVGQTYVLSAKIIDVATGRVVAQASAQKEGKIDVVLLLAPQVGEQLAARGSSAPPRPAAEDREQPTAEKPAPLKPAAYRHGVLLEVSYTTETSDFSEDHGEEFLIGAAYYLSLWPKAGLTASAGYGIWYGSWTLQAGAFFTPFPPLSVGLTAGYVHAASYFGEDSGISCFSAGPVVLYRLGMMAFSAHLKLVFPGLPLNFGGGVGFVF